MSHLIETGCKNFPPLPPGSPCFGLRLPKYGTDPNAIEVWIEHKGSDTFGATSVNLILQHPRPMHLICRDSLLGGIFVVFQEKKRLYCTHTYLWF